MQFTRLISAILAQHWKALPIVAAALLCIFISGFRTILRLRKQRFLLELMLCLSCFGISFSLMCFCIMGFIDPANHHLVRQVRTEEGLERLAMLGWSSFALALLSGVALEIFLRKARNVRA